MSVPDIFSLELKLTDRCNGRCFFCMNDDGASRRAALDGQLMAERLREWAAEEKSTPWRLKEVRMTGGEPLLELDSLLRIARTCREAGITSGINTNASLLDEPTCDALTQAGLKVVKASLDAVDAGVFQQMRGDGADFEEALAGIRRARRAGFKLILRLTLSSLNRPQLVECYRLARELGAATFQVKPLVYSGRATESRHYLSRDQVREAFGELREAAREEGPEAVVLCWPPEEAAGLRVKSCGSLNKLYVAADGQVSLCNYIPDEKPMGNLLVEPLGAILRRRRLTLAAGAYGHEIPAGCPQWELIARQAPAENLGPVPYSQGT